MPKDVRRVKLRRDVHDHFCDGIAEAFALGVHGRCVIHWRIQLLAISESISIVLPPQDPAHRTFLPFTAAIQFPLSCYPKPLSYALSSVQCDTHEQGKFSSMPVVEKSIFHTQAQIILE